MSLAFATLLPRSLDSGAHPVPPCPECATSMHAVGGGRHRYWTCRFCSVTMPRH